MKRHVGKQQLSDSEAAAGGQRSRWERGERMTVLQVIKETGTRVGRTNEEERRETTGGGRKSATSGKTSQTGED